MGADVGGDATEADAAVLAANSTNYLLCLCEVSADSETGTAQFGLLALQCATGPVHEIIQWVLNLYNPLS